MDLTNLRLMSEGDKTFEKEMIETAINYLPEIMSTLSTAIKKGDFVNIKATAHTLKSSFFMVGIDDESILNKLEIEQIEDFGILDNLFNRLEKKLLASLKSLENELINL
jgi:HPt (histidine-containing phosphotransfer) domain-containing protein